MTSDLKPRFCPHRHVCVNAPGGQQTATTFEKCDVGFGEMFLAYCTDGHLLPAGVHFCSIRPHNGLSCVTIQIIIYAFSAPFSFWNIPDKNYTNFLQSAFDLLIHLFSATFQKDDSGHYLSALTLSTDIKLTTLLLMYVNTPLPPGGHNKQTEDVRGFSVKRILVILLILH